MKEEQYSKESTEEVGLDRDILRNLSLKILDTPEGMDQAITAAGNAASPAKGLSQFVVMLIQQVTEALQNAGVEVEAGVWLADGGVLDELIPEFIDILAEAGIEVDEPTFGDELFALVSDAVKGIVQAEEAQQGAPASPTAGAGDMLSQAPLLG